MSVVTEGCEKMLWEIAYNLWWSWDPKAKNIFEILDPIVWQESIENPIEFLGKIDLQERLKNQQIVNLINYVYTRFKNYMMKHSHYEDIFKNPIVFISAEYGLHHSLPIYAGGLGFLAGDILKESSDMGFPMIGIGFMYPQGYVKQKIREDGWQEEEFFSGSKEKIPAQQLVDKDGNPIKLSVPFKDDKIFFKVWKVNVGKTPLFLIDTDTEENPPENRGISSKLYIGDKIVKLKQKIVLGFGAIALVKKLGIKPTGFHINEDYPSFACLGLLVEEVSKGKSFEDALKFVRAKFLFTTHTPLRAAVNIYPPDMLREYLSFTEKYGIKIDKILELGVNPDNPSEGFNATVMAMRLSKYINAVSRTHQEVTRKIWKFASYEEMKIDYVTNGIHIPTWICPTLREVIEKYLGEDWTELQDKKFVWEMFNSIPNELLWEIHIKNKKIMIDHIIERARRIWAKERKQSIVAEGIFFDPDYLTIGFARRITGYKRADLILYDTERLKKILLNPARPVQIIFAGKAHPEDIDGKKTIQRIYNIAKDPEFQGRIAFIEDYDERLAHYLVKGVDVWLNNPMPPLEACGTSGMKASVNGVLHISVLDGWWPEGFNGKNGWAFGGDKTEDSSQDPNASDANQIYNLIEQEIVPLYYDRNEKGIPEKWVEKMKEAIKTIAPNFSARRMLKEYIDKFYSKLLEACD